MALRRLACALAFVLFVCAGHLFAQETAPKSYEPVQLAATVDDLKALVFVLQTQLNAVEKELAREKTRRVELEEAELKRARETLDPAIKKRLGLPVPDAPKAEEKPAPQTPPK